MTAGRFRSGLSLVEILVSVAILSSCAVFVAQALGQAAYAQAQSDERRAAYLFALSKLAALELDAQLGKSPDEGDSGRFQAEGRQFEWHATAGADALDPATTHLALEVLWIAGHHEYVERYAIQVRRPFDDATLSGDSDG